MDVSFTSYPIQEWLVDNETAQLGDVELSVDAIAQDVKFALSTERNKYPIMGSNFGVEFEDLIGMDEDYVRANVKSRIQEALSIDDRIDDLGSFSFSKPSPDSLLVTFIVESVLGPFEVTTEIIGG